MGIIKDKKGAPRQAVSPSQSLFLHRETVTLPGGGFFFSRGAPAMDEGRGRRPRRPASLSFRASDRVTGVGIRVLCLPLHKRGLQRGGAALGTDCHVALRREASALGVLLARAEKGGMTRCRDGRLCPPEWITYRHGGASYPKGICSAALHCGTPPPTDPCPGRSSLYDRKRPPRMVGAPSLCVCVRRERENHIRKSNSF